MIPWQINIELRMTPEEAAGLASVLNVEQHPCLYAAIGDALKDFKEKGYAQGRLVLGLGGPEPGRTKDPDPQWATEDEVQEKFHKDTISDEEYWENTWESA